MISLIGEQLFELAPSFWLKIEAVPVVWNGRVVTYLRSLRLTRKVVNSWYFANSASHLVNRFNKLVAAGICNVVEMYVGVDSFGAGAERKIYPLALPRLSGTTSD